MMEFPIPEKTVFTLGRDFLELGQHQYVTSGPFY